MSENQQDERPDAEIEDLDVDPTQADEIAGGRTPPSDIPIIKVYDKPSPIL